MAQPLRGCLTRKRAPGRNAGLLPRAGRPYCGEEAQRSPRKAAHRAAHPAACLVPRLAARLTQDPARQARERCWQRHAAAIGPGSRLRPHPPGVLVCCSSLTPLHQSPVPVSLLAPGSFPWSAPSRLSGDPPVDAGDLLDEAPPERVLQVEQLPERPMEVVRHVADLLVESVRGVSQDSPRRPPVKSTAKCSLHAGHVTVARVCPSELILR